MKLSAGSIACKQNVMLLRAIWKTAATCAAVLKTAVGVPKFGGTSGQILAPSGFTQEAISAALVVFVVLASLKSCGSFKP